MENKKDITIDKNKEDFERFLKSLNSCKITIVHSGDTKDFKRYKQEFNAEAEISLLRCENANTPNTGGPGEFFDLFIHIPPEILEGFKDGLSVPLALLIEKLIKKLRKKPTKSVITAFDESYVKHMENDDESSPNNAFGITYEVPPNCTDEDLEIIFKKSSEVTKKLRIKTEGGSKFFIFSKDKKTFIEVEQNHSDY